jgi:hypothetical protein
LKVGAVAALGEAVGQDGQLIVVDPPVAPGDLLNTADLVSLAGLDDVDELACVEQPPEGPRVEPCGAAGEDGHGELAALEVDVVDPGDLQLSPGARLELAGHLDDGVVVEVDAGNGVAGLGLGRLLLDRQHLPLGVELDDAVVLRVGHAVGEDMATGDVGGLHATDPPAKRHRRCCRRGPGPPSRIR